MPLPNDQLLDFLNAEDLLGADPRLSFFSFQDQFGQSPAQRRHFRGEFQNFFDRYVGGIGRQLQQEQSPTGTFTNFLRDIDFGSEFSAIPPSMRGGGTRRFAPPTRFLGF